VVVLNVMAVALACVLAGIWVAAREFWLGVALVMVTLVAGAIVVRRLAKPA
jgi:hypothetical protein